jgi:probable F420-dependent oxidoreductase
MKVDTFAGSIRQAPENAQVAESLGLDGVVTSEVKHDPFFPLAAAALATSRVELITSIAVAFARSPMTVALQARDLNDASNGRFVLGLGSQIKPHITRRYSMPWSRPAARMREYVQAVRAIWRCWNDGSRLQFEGDFYRHTLMPPMMVPEPTGLPDPRVVVAAVNSGMSRVAGEVGDGLHCHGFCTPLWIEKVIIPAAEEGLAESGRARSQFEISCPAMVVTGIDEKAVAESMEAIRATIAFYGSTPAYRPVLELHGWQDLGVELHRCSVSGQWEQMAALVPDEVVNAFAVVADWDELPDTLLATYGGLVDRLMYGLPVESAPPDVVAGMVGRLHAGAISSELA